MVHVQVRSIHVYLIFQTDLCSDERLFAEKAAEYNTLHTQYLSVMERSSELEKILDELHETKLSLEREVHVHVHVQ